MSEAHEQRPDNTQTPDGGQPQEAGQMSDMGQMPEADQVSDTGRVPAPQELPASPHPERRPAGTRSSRMRELGVAAIAILLYLLLLDAAVETFLSGSPLRWIVGGTVTAYVALSMLLWRRLGWGAKSALSLLIFLGLLTVTAWLPRGLSQGVILLQQPTSGVLAAVTALAVLLSGAILLRAESVPIRAKVVVALLIVYAVGALAMGILSGTPYPDLFHGRSLWGRLPFWLQGPFIGAVVLVTCALLYQVITGILRIRGAELRGWGVQVLALSMSLVISGSGLAVPAGSPPSEAQQPSISELARQGREQFVARLDRLYQDLEAAHNALPRDSFDLRAVVDQVGHDPIKLYQWVRDNTYWVPYQGSLRGPVGVLMDRLGNSLDRALLLAELLRLAGQEVRLARGRLNDEEALRLLAAIRQVPLAPQPVPPAADGKPIQERTQKAIAGLMKMLEAVVPAPRREDVTTQRQELAAISDHWWVQTRKEGNWLDMDPLHRAAKAGDAVATAVQTIPPEEVDATLSHEVAVRVVVEQWREGNLREQIAMEHTIRPTQLIGQRISLSFIPLNWQLNREEQSAGVSINQFKAQVMAVNEWLPVLQVGDGQVAQASFTNSGRVNPKPSVGGPNGTGRTAVAPLGGVDLTGEPGEREKPGGQLSAVWLEFELHSPGRKPQKIRRQVVDVLGPAARASGKRDLQELPESLRLERALALLGEVEILPLVSDLSVEFVLHLSAHILLVNRDIFSGVAALQKAPEEEDLMKVVDALTSAPGALHLLAIGRHGLSQVRAERFLDRPNILLLLSRLKLSGPDGLLRQVIVDIVNNDVAVRPGASTSPYRIRLEQGIVDTVVEGMILPPGGYAENTADLFARVEAQKKRVVVIRNIGDEGWRQVDIGDDARARMEEDLRAGYVIVAPSSPIEIDGRPRFGWWRTHPVSGETLGVMESGFHSPLTETKISDTVISKTMITTTARARALWHGGLLSVYGWILQHSYNVLSRLIDFSWRMGSRPGDLTYSPILRAKLAIMYLMMQHPWWKP